MKVCDSRQSVERKERLEKNNKRAVLARLPNGGTRRPSEWQQRSRANGSQSERQMHTPTHTTTAGIRFTALDLGLEAPCAGAVRVSLEAFGVVQRGRIIGTDQLDGDGVLVINETFILELAEGSSLRSEVLDALLSSDVEASDAHFVVHRMGGAEADEADELASGFISLSSLLGTKELEAPMHTRTHTSTPALPLHTPMPRRLVP